TDGLPNAVPLSHFPPDQAAMHLLPFNGLARAALAAWTT
ncbi:MAG: hypothetical protein H6R45_433, partial [Proteobacteria bacterium]|nr:hypothetical protein [Pseudomonadota bacterium]